MPKYRFVWPFYIEDCYECGKALHFQWPLERVVRLPSVSEMTHQIMIEQARAVMEHDGFFSRDALVLTKDGKVVTIPKVDNF